MGTFGLSTQGGTATSMLGERNFMNNATGNRNLTLCKATLTEGAGVTSISMHVSRDDQSTYNLELTYVIYSDSGGLPLTLMAATPASSGLTTNQPKRSGTPNFALITLSLTSQVNLVPGTYWIGYLMDRTNGQTYDWRDATGNMYQVVDSYSDGPSSSVNTSGYTTSTETVSIYATYTPIRMPPRSPATDFGFPAMV